MVGIVTLLMIPERKNQKIPENQQKQVGGMVRETPKKAITKTSQVVWYVEQPKKKPLNSVMLVPKKKLQKPPNMVYDGICECVCESKQKNNSNKTYPSEKLILCMLLIKRKKKKHNKSPRVVSPPTKYEKQTQNGLLSTTTKSKEKMCCDGGMKKSQNIRVSLCEKCPLLCGVV